MQDVLLSRYKVSLVHWSNVSDPFNDGLTESQAKLLYAIWDHYKGKGGIMASRERFEPADEDVHWIKPITEGNLKYGYRIVELYDQCMCGDMKALFVSGVSGMVFGRSEPSSDDAIRNILQSGMICRPEDQKIGRIAVSGGQHATCVKSYWRNINLRWYRCVRFQGDLKEILQDDYPKEDTGTMAVALAGNLAIQAIMPSTRNEGIVLNRVTLAGMSEDEKHRKPWIAVEFDLYIHQSLFSPIPFPHDRKTGYVPLDALESMMKSETVDK